MTHDCTRTDAEPGSQLQLRDGTGPNHAANSANRPAASTATTNGSTNQHQYGPMNGSGGQMRTGG
jgi:hypothetical protein